jgi:hypothetical protein
MSKGKAREAWSLNDIPKIPLSASLHKASIITGFSREAIKSLIAQKKITAIEYESKIEVSMWSLIEYLNLAPIEVLKELWKQSA